MTKQMKWSIASILILLGVAVGVCGCSQSQKETKVAEPKKEVKEVFYYTGDNLKEYAGEPVFYVDCVNELTEKQENEFYAYGEKRFTSVKKLVFSDKFKGMYFPEGNIYFPNMESIKIGANTEAGSLICAARGVTEKLERIDISPQNKESYSVDGVAYWKNEILCVPYAWKKTTLVLPKQITYLQVNTISCPNIKKLVLNKALKEVALYPAYIAEDGDDPECGYGANELYAMEKLEKITVPKDSKYYVVKDDALYKKEGNGRYEFEGYPVGNQTRKRVEILDGVTAIKGLSTDMKNLTVVLPDTVKKVRDFPRYKTKYVVHNSNPYLMNFKESLYNKSGTKLLHFYTGGKKKPTIWFPDTVVKAPRKRFRFLRYLKVYVKGGKYGEQWSKLKKQILDGDMTKVLWVRSY